MARSILLASFLLLSFATTSALGFQSGSAGVKTITDRVVLDSAIAQQLFPKFLTACMKVGAEKLESQAEAFGIKVDMNSLRVSEVSDMGPSAYTWWSVDVTDVNGRLDVFPAGTKPVLNKLVQYSGKKCY